MCPFLWPLTAVVPHGTDQKLEWCYWYYYLCVCMSVCEREGECAPVQCGDEGLSGSSYTCDHPPTVTFWQSGNKLSWQHILLPYLSSVFSSHCSYASRQVIFKGLCLHASYIARFISLEIVGWHLIWTPVLCYWVFLLLLVFFALICFILFGWLVMCKYEKYLRSG